MSVICDINFGISEHPGTSFWDNIDKRWVYFDKVLRGTALTRFRNKVLYPNYISKEDADDQWTLGEPYNVDLYDF